MLGGSLVDHHFLLLRDFWCYVIIRINVCVNINSLGSVVKILQIFICCVVETMY
jgi:hypothetical protein